MNLDRGDRVVAAGVATGDVLLVMHELGHGKAVPLAEYPVKGRATGGVVSANPGVPKKEPAGPGRRRPSRCRRPARRWC